jgi:beta-lactamase class A
VTDPADRVSRCFEDAGVTGSLHAVALHDRDRQIGVAADDTVVLASVFKLVLLVAFARCVDAATLDPAHRITLEPGRRTPGPTGISAMDDPVTVSLRDAARSMMTVSDNAAADALLDVVGLAAVQDTLADLGLRRTRVAGGVRDLYASVLEDSEQASLGDAVAALADPVTLSRLRALDPASEVSSVGTARDLTTLLDAIWADRAASADQCGFIRAVMGQQVWTQRLAAGFPFDDVVVAGKTGTFVTVRNEAGVVSYPNGERYAIAVFTTSAGARLVDVHAEAAIAQAARFAVAALR